MQAVKVAKKLHIKFLRLCRVPFNSILLENKLYQEIGLHK